MTVHTAFTEELAGLENRDHGERWPARLVATAAKDRLSLRRNRASFAAASDCRTIAIYEYRP
jgi:hypothetical protein